MLLEQNINKIILFTEQADSKLSKELIKLAALCNNSPIEFIEFPLSEMSEQDELLPQVKSSDSLSVNPSLLNRPNYWRPRILDIEVEIALFKKLLKKASIEKTLITQKKA